MMHRATRYARRLLGSLFLRKTNKPQILSYLINDQCNSHCITCKVWQNKESREITPDRLNKLLREDLFSEVKHVGISGGEPSLSPSLESHIRTIVETLPSVQTLSITTNCISPDFWIAHLDAIHQFCKSRSVSFQLNLSLDGIGSLHDRIRGTKGNFDSFEKVLFLLKEEGIPYQIHSTINRYNVYHVNAILRYAKSHNADLIFRLASEISRLQNSQLIERVALNDKQISFFCDFLSSRNLQEYTRSPGRRLYYRSLVRQLLKEKTRLAPCSFKEEGIVLASNGEISHCSRFDSSFAHIGRSDDWLCAFRDQAKNEAFISDRCENCYHDQTGFWPPAKVFSELWGKRFIPVQKIYWIVTYLLTSFCSLPRKAKDEPVKSVAITGMYGGEHVGDAAILGGVIQRIRTRYPLVKEVSVFSFRKDRTACWVANLTELRGISFSLYDSEKEFARRLKECQLLVWGGGPMMELPVVMTRNYFFIRKALSAGCKFEIEGIGYGPVNTFFGKWMSGLILKKASRVTVRSEKDQQHVTKITSVDDSRFPVDPAFDYLASLPAELELSPEEKKEVDKLVRTEPGQKKIALNLRPLWNRYGKNNSFSYDHFLTEVAHALSRLIAEDYVILFFPMNADQFGFSDLDTAYELQERLGNSPSFRVWETELSINKGIYFLRNVDYSICMRFHAAIFSLSQQIKTIGLDYSLSGKGKVSSLYSVDDPSCLNIVNLQSTDIIHLIKQFDNETHRTKGELF